MASVGRLDAAQPAAEDKQNLRKVVTASFIGTTIEWYDFFLYGTAAALVFNELFFPDSSPLIGTLAAFGTFAVGFAARPLGGIVFGHFGDRIGRKAMLVLSLLIMGVATFLIGCLPTHASIGVARPDPAGPAALRAGHRRRRRVGRRGADVRRARAEGQARPLRRVPADGRAGRPAALDGRLHHRAEHHHRGAVHGLGLAHPVPGLDRARRGRPVHPPGGHGVAGVQGDQGERHGVRQAARRPRQGRTSATC